MVETCLMFFLRNIYKEYQQEVTRMNWNFSYVSLKCLLMKIRITTALEAVTSLLIRTR